MPSSVSNGSLFLCFLLLQIFVVVHLQRVGMEMDIGWEFESNGNEGWGNATSEVTYYSFNFFRACVFPLHSFTYIHSSIYCLYMYIYPCEYVYEYVFRDGLSAQHI